MSTISPKRASPQSPLEQETSPQPPSQEGGHSQLGYVVADSKLYPLVKEERARLKKNTTPAETILWEYVKNQKLGYRIRRQYVIDRYIVDFVCLLKNLIIEVDGDVHDSQKEHDLERTIHLNSLGYEVMRFSNEEVITAPEFVTEKIKIKLQMKEAPLLGRGVGGRSLKEYSNFYKTL